MRGTLFSIKLNGNNLHILGVFLAVLLFLGVGIIAF